MLPQNAPRITKTEALDSELRAFIEHIHHATTSRPLLRVYISACVWIVATSTFTAIDQQGSQPPSITMCPKALLVLLGVACLASAAPTTATDNKGVIEFCNDGFYMKPCITKDVLWDTCQEVPDSTVKGDTRSSVRIVSHHLESKCCRLIMSHRSTTTPDGIATADSTLDLSVQDWRPWASSAMSSSGV